MGMEIKRDEPLTPEARQYLMDRNQHDVVAAVDEQYPPEVDPTVVGPNDGWTPATGFENLSDDDLLAELERRRAAAGADSGDVLPYEEWTREELDAELAERRDSKGEPLATGGTVPQKVKRLKDHDAWLATQSPV